MRKLSIPIIILLIMVIASITSCIHSRSFHNQEDIQSAINGVLEMNVSFEYQMANSTIWASKKNKGAVISLGDGYVLGLTHCFTTKTILINSPWGAFNADIKSRNIEYTIDDKKLYIVGEHEDISLFRMIRNDDFMDAYPFEWADSNDLWEGDRIVLAGFPWMFDRNLRSGIVSDVNPTHPGIDTKNLFAFSINAIGGDSGTPVLVYRWGVLKIIGLAQISTGRGISFALKSNYVLDAIETIKAAAK